MSEKTTPIGSVPELKENDVIPRIEGRVIFVNDPLDPTAAQAKAGIYPQDIKIVDERDNKVKIKFMKKSQHLDRDSVGDWMVFESTPDDKGDLRGLKKCDNIAYNKSQGVDKDPFHWIQADSFMNCWVATSEPEAMKEKASQVAPAGVPTGSAEDRASDDPGDPQTQPQAQVDQPLGEAAVEIAAQRFKATAIQGSGSGFDPLAQHYDPGSVEARCQEWLSVWMAVAPMARAAGVPEEKIGDLTTHIRMDFTMKGNSPVFSAPPQQAAPQQAAPQQAAPQQAAPQQAPFGQSDDSWKNQVDQDRILVCQYGHEKLCEAVIAYASYDGESDFMKGIKRAAAMTMRERKITWEQVYDYFSGVLKQKHSMTVVDAVHDHFRAQLKDRSDSEFYKIIIMDTSMFTSQIEIEEAK